MTTGFVMTGMLLLVQHHRRVPHERVAAVRSGTVEVPIDAIAVATRQPTVDHFIVEGETWRYVDVVVKVLTVHEQLVRSIGGEMATRLQAVVVSGRPKDAGSIRTPFRIVRGESFGLAQTVRR